MGANKRSRFHGHDPRYKNRERVTLADVLPTEVNGWEEEADRFLADRQLTDWKISRPVGRRIDLFKVTPNPELEEVVKRYIANRDSEASIEEQPSELDLHNREIQEAPELVALKTPTYALEPMQIAPASRDILLQMFIGRKIGQGLLHAGRRWQWDRETATLQPSVSIDWSRSTPSPYQCEELSEHQWEAMRRRRRFIGHAGLSAATMLDFFLEIDRGYSELMKLTGLSVVKIERELERLLEKVCDCFAE